MTNPLIRILIALAGGLAVILAVVSILAWLTSGEPSARARRPAAPYGGAENAHWWREDYETVARGVIVPLDVAPSLLRQCSRVTVSPIEAYWRPAPENVELLEENLPRLFERPAAERPPPLDGYVRQYAGVVSDGRAYIYASFLPGDVWRHADWRSNVVTYCGGGARYWGVAFDVESRTFRDLAFNGSE
jgi:hypothetical protein